MLVNKFSDKTKAAGGNMPFIEVFDFEATSAQREVATELLTESLCMAYDISRSIVSIYFFDVSARGYGHAGRFHDKASVNRIFIKIHAFMRTETDRMVAAARITEATMLAYDTTSPKQIVVYFLDRDPSEVSHGGILESKNHINT
ncbi:hypothetical protein CAP48_04230 [Advenella sp. S44]|nr:hypothetical protein CAP48_04230 [Advenella sp. S44]